MNNNQNNITPHNTSITPDSPAPNPIVDNPSPTEPYPPQSETTAQSKPKKKVWKVLLIIFGVFFGIFLLAILIFTIVASASDKLICETDTGKSITLLYDENGLKGYAAFNVSFDLDKQKIVASSMGIDSYLQNFAELFEQKSSGAGVCRVEKRDGSIEQISSDTSF